MSNNTTSNTNIRYKVITIGNWGSGKSCVLTRLIKNIFVLYSFSTIGIQFQSLRIKKDKKDNEIDNYEYMIDFMDTCGQERFKSIIPMYFRNCSVILCVLDITTKDLIEQLNEWLEIFVSNIHSFKPNYKLYLIFNKFDLNPSFKLTRNLIGIIDRYIEKEKYSTFITSCKDNFGLVDLKNDIISFLNKEKEKDEKENKEEEEKKGNKVNLEDSSSYSYYNLFSNC